MSASVNEVVVTGLGVVSAAGPTFSDLADALASGRQCASPVDSPLPLKEWASVPGEIPKHADFKNDRKAWLAFAALEEALLDAKLPSGSRTSVFLGTGLSSITPEELEEDAFRHLPSGAERFDRASLLADLSPDHLAPWRHDPIRVTSMVAKRVGATGPCGTSFSACSAAAQAIAEGLRTLRRGEADVAIVGGHDSMLHPFGLLSFVVLGALSETSCRPFDKNRDGFLIGEGSAMLVLETAAHAKARGARIRAQLLGAGTSADGYNATAPHPEGAGAEKAMRGALKDADIKPSQIDYVNAHATGTPVGDIAESMAISRVIGSVPVSSIKGAIGHTIAAAGAIEAAACIAALQGGWMPGTVGLQSIDPECPVSALERSVDRPPKVVLSNSFGFGGQNAALVLAHEDWSRHG